MGKFIAKHKIKLSPKAIALIFIGVLSLIVTFNVLLKSEIEKLVGPSFSDALLDNGLNKKSFNLDILNPKDLLRLGLNFVFKENKTVEDVKVVKNHTNSDEPLVYIYNSHESEAYSSSLIESYSIKYTVKIASYLLSDRLKDLDVPSFVEPTSIIEFATANGSAYSNLYDASRIFLERRLAEYPSIALAVDIHRDAASRDETTATIGEKPCAKILFVVGMENERAEENLKTAEKLNSLLDSKLTRGIVKKTKEEGNGKYNQDLSEKAVLIEIGGADNTIDEVTNTLELLSNAIFKYVNGE